MACCDKLEIETLSAEHTKAYGRGDHGTCISIIKRLRQIKGTQDAPRPRRRAFATGYTTW